MRELREGDRFVARDGTKTGYGTDISGKTGVVRSLTSDWPLIQPWTEVDTTVYLDEQQIGFFNVKRSDLKRLPKHLSDKPLRGWRKLMEEENEDNGVCEPFLYPSSRHRADDIEEVDWNA